MLRPRSNARRGQSHKAFMPLFMAFMALFIIALDLPMDLSVIPRDVSLIKRFICFFIFFYIGLGRKSRPTRVYSHHFLELELQRENKRYRNICI